MMKYIYLLALCLVVACSSKKETPDSTLQANEHDSFILDSLIQFDSEEQLIAKFKSGNVARDTVYYPEGMGSYMVSVLYPGTKNEVLFTWQDTLAFKELLVVTIHGDSSQWSTHGVKIGTPLTELIRLAGHDFVFAGLGWDYGGVVSWGEEAGGLSDVSLILGGDPLVEMSPEEMDSLMGDRPVSSKSPSARRYNPLVREISLSSGRHVIYD